MAVKKTQERVKSSRDLWKVLASEDLRTFREVFVLRSPDQKEELGSYALTFRYPEIREAFDMLGQLGEMEQSDVEDVAGQLYLNAEVLYGIAQRVVVLGEDMEWDMGIFQRLLVGTGGLDGKFVRTLLHTVHGGAGTEGMMGKAENEAERSDLLGELQDGVFNRGKPGDGDSGRA